jgi:hypothetical protein
MKNPPMKGYQSAVVHNSNQNKIKNSQLFSDYLFNTGVVQKPDFSQPCDQIK